MYNKEGPPFGVSVNQILELTNNRFKVIENSFSEHSIDPRLGREKLIILEKI